MTTPHEALISSPLCRLRLTSNGKELTGIQFLPAATADDAVEVVPDDAVLREAARQLRAYFAGALRTFDLPLKPAGTEFQRQVWEELLRAPFGQTRSYLQVAQGIGRPTACRAVGAANGRNPIPIVIPCHRIIGNNGALTGYAGGMEIKRWLLEHEAKVLGGSATALVG